jgi:hypothetical protein
LLEGSQRALNRFHWQGQYFSLKPLVEVFNSLLLGFGHYRLGLTKRQTKQYKPSRVPKSSGSERPIAFCTYQRHLIYGRDFTKLQNGLITQKSSMDQTKNPAVSDRWVSDFPF